jgi:hypothetical protein
MEDEIAGNGMKMLGGLITFSGIALLLFAFNFEITNPSSQYVNLGLMDDKRNYVIISGVLILCGVILIGFGSIQEQSNSGNNGTMTRQCPFCAEAIRLEAKICRFCNRDVPTHADEVNNAQINSSKTKIAPPNATDPNHIPW